MTFALPSLFTKYLICKVCQFVLINPMRIYRCGHTFCEKCIMTDKCAHCGEHIEAKQIDLTATGIVLESKVKCLMKECSYRGTYEDYLNTHKGRCKYKGNQGLQGWIDMVKQRMSETPKARKHVTIDCQVVVIPEQKAPVQLYDVTSSKYGSALRGKSQMASVYIDNRIDHKVIQNESFYNVHPDHQSKAAEQARLRKQNPPMRKCSYGKHCTLLRQPTGCPYYHPEKYSRRDYSLQTYNHIPVSRPSKVSEEELRQKFKQQRQTKRFMTSFFKTNMPHIQTIIEKDQVEQVIDPKRSQQKNCIDIA